MSNYIKVFAGSFVEVQHVFQSLEAENICAIIKDESESGRIAGFGGAVHDHKEIYVHKDELDKVKPIIERLTSELES